MRPPRMTELRTRRRVDEILSPSSRPSRTLPPRPMAGLDTFCQNGRARKNPQLLGQGLECGNSAEDGQKHR